MSVSGQYSSPEIVNGYVCWNCADVAKAKKDINPAQTSLDPSSASGANGASGSNGASGAPQSPAVVFGGVLANAGAATGSSATGVAANGQANGAGGATGQTTAALWAPGAQLNITA